MSTRWRPFLISFIFVVFAFASCLFLFPSRLAVAKKKIAELPCINHMQVVFDKAIIKNEDPKALPIVAPKEAICPITKKPYFHAFGGLEYDKIKEISNAGIPNIPIFWDVDTSSGHKLIIVLFLNGGVSFYNDYDDVNELLMDVVRENMIQGAVLEKMDKPYCFKLIVPVSGNKKGILVFGKNIPYKWSIE